jgi:hypothetical protein
MIVEYFEGIFMRSFSSKKIKGCEKFKNEKSDGKI